MPMMPMAMFGPGTLVVVVVIMAAVDEVEEDEDKGEELVTVELGKLRVDGVDGTLTVEVTTSIRLEVLLVAVEVTVELFPMVVVKT
jgi:hypothetical protein